MGLVKKNHKDKINKRMTVESRIVGTKPIRKRGSRHWNNGRGPRKGGRGWGANSGGWGEGLRTVADTIGGTKLAV